MSAYLDPVTAFVVVVGGGLAVLALAVILAGWMVANEIHNKGVEIKADAPDLDEALVIAHREGWDACADFGRNTVPAAGSKGILHARERDARYPLPSAAK